MMSAHIKLHDCMQSSPAWPTSSVSAARPVGKYSCACHTHLTMRMSWLQQEARQTSHVDGNAECAKDVPEVVL